MDVPRMPAFGLRWRCATVTGDFNPVKVPLIVNVLPFTVAVTDPEPAIVASIGASTGTIDRRARYCVDCADSETAMAVAIATARTR